MVLMTAETRPLVDKLHDLLGRKSPLDVLPRTVEALGELQPPDFASLRTAAVCFDANIVLRAANHRDRAQLIDYFSTRHKGPLIVSAQAIQEFWNNYSNVLETVSKGLEKRIVALQDSFSQMEEVFEPFRDRFQEVLDDFKRDFDFMLDPKSRANVAGFIEMLDAHGALVEAPRLEFIPYAQLRESMRTPPGFKDRGNGDFFVWIDFLLGLIAAERPFEKAIFVTQDRKADWMRGKVPHPTLTAEVRKLTGKSLEMWSLDSLVAGAKDA